LINFSLKINGYSHLKLTMLTFFRLAKWYFKLTYEVKLVKIMYTSDPYTHLICKKSLIHLSYEDYIIHFKSLEQNCIRV